MTTDVGDFFKGNRFPKLVRLSLREISHDGVIVLECPTLWDLHIMTSIGASLNLKIVCSSVLNMGFYALARNDDEENYLGSQSLILDCPSLARLKCGHSRLAKLDLNCPHLIDLNCLENRLTELNLECYHLRNLVCEYNPLSNLNGIEFCTKLKTLACSSDLLRSAKTLIETHLPDLELYCGENRVTLQDILVDEA